MLVKSYYIILLNYLMFADDIRVFSLSVCWLQTKNTTLDRCVSGLCRIAWDYFQLQQNCLYSMTFKAKSAKSQSPHYCHWVVKM